MRRIRVFTMLRGSNPQCVIGAGLCLVSVFLPWLLLQTAWPHLPVPVGGVYEPVLDDSSLSLLDIVALITGPARIFCALFAIGVVLSFFTPLGGIVQGVGLSGFVYGYAQVGGEYSVTVYRLVPEGLLNDYPECIYSLSPSFLGVGYLVAIVSTFMVLSSTSCAVRAVRRGPTVHSRIAALAWNASRMR